ncbi:MAG TPA: molecular chaperone DnaK, partial [Alphaproteobacteria bacterium]|nr:molecular chaperone DnaK [Alphaproteobacteria bacterium]HBA42696.1 molecular chaperone DnaK [Alphaproteobacteria bacterium]HBC54966.1 molecular chaperone DnaK [Alphaproteobacteria bacterium]
EREMAADNKFLNQFDLVGIPAAPRGVPQIEVTFDIDANGIVNVSAKDKATGKEQHIQIQASGGLSDAEIEQMVKDAESHAEEDKKRRESVEIRNQAEQAIHTTERTLTDAGDKAPADVKQTIETAIADLRSALEDENAGKDVLEPKIQALMEASMKLGEAMYSQEQDAAQPPEGETAAAGDDDVVDADFEEVDDDKKNQT